MSLEEITERTINKVGFYPLYVVGNSGSSGFPKGKLVYALNCFSWQFDPVSGNPVTFYGEKIPLTEFRVYNQEFNPVPAREKEVPAFVPSARISEEEADAIAAEFCKKLGFDEILTRRGYRT
ncbi:MAG TPA: hypothetical protein GX691_02295 [Clostridia bacterium]|jgi:hypothetical protein|nr:hypothetical protein [Clostridia bacterium]